MQSSQVVDGLQIHASDSLESHLLVCRKFLSSDGVANVACCGNVLCKCVCVVRNEHSVAQECKPSSYRTKTYGIEFAKENALDDSRRIVTILLLNYACAHWILK